MLPVLMEKDRCVLILQEFYSIMVIRQDFFTSPHLDDITERIRINGIMISQEDFEEAYWYVEEHRTQELAYFDYLFWHGNVLLQ